MSDKKKPKERSIVELIESPAQGPEKRWQDNYDGVSLDSLTREKSFSGGIFGTSDEGTGLWTPEKRAMIDQHNLKNLFYSEIWVFVCCTLYAKKISRQPLRVVREEVTNGRRAWKPVDDHPYNKTMRRPNAWETYRQFMQRVVAELMLMGNAICWQMRYSKGMMLLPTELIDLDFDSRSRLKGYRFLGSGISEDIQVPGLNRADFYFKQEDAIHFRLPNLNSMLWGLSPYVPGRRSVLFDRYSTEYLLNFYWNQGNAGMILEMDKEANETNAVRLIKSYENALTGRRNARRTMLLPKGVTASNIQQKMAEQELSEHIGMRREEIMALLHIPPHEVGLQKTGSLGSEETKAAIRNFWEAGILPVQELIAEVLTDAWRRTGDLSDEEELQFDNSDVQALQENMLDKATTANAMLKTKTINEVRAEVWEDEPLEGGDVLEAEFNAAVAQKYALPQFGGAPNVPNGEQPGNAPAPDENQAPLAPGGDVPASPAAPATEVNVDQLRPDANGNPPDRMGAYSSRQVATVAMFHGDHMLMGQRRDNGRWTCPGGHLDPGESGHQGALREVMEETGIQLAPETLKLLGEPKEVDTGKGNVMVHAFRADLEGDRPKPTAGEDPDGEFTKFAWVNVKQGLPKTVRDNLHVPMDRNVLFEQAGLKGSGSYTRANKALMDERQGKQSQNEDEAHGQVLDSTLNLLADFAAAAVQIAKDQLAKKKTKAAGDGGNQDDKVEGLPAQAQLRRALGRSFDALQEKWVEGNLDTLSKAMESGYDLQMQTPFQLPNPQEAQTLRKQNASGRREMLASRLLDSFDHISATTSDEILGVIADGLSNSETLDQIAKNIVLKIANVDNAGYRAERIARTEALTAISLGQWAATQDAQKLMPGMELMWITAGDNRVRDSHASQDGDQVPAGKKFKNGLLYPRDPAGAADEVINCRCTFLMVPPDDGSGLDFTAPPGNPVPTGDKGPIVPIGSKQ
jgi:HK97 family phage portal protein